MIQKRLLNDLYPSERVRLFCVICWILNKIKVKKISQEWIYILTQILSSNLTPLENSEKDILTFTKVILQFLFQAVIFLE
jgi:hypothetical protein